MNALASVVGKYDCEGERPRRNDCVNDPHPFHMTPEQRVEVMRVRWEAGQDIWDGRPLTKFQRYGV